MIEGVPALVIDATYECNASCRYCQWGVPGEPGRSVKGNLRVPKETLSALGTKRVVFSGGEPLLRGDLEDLVDYYRGAGVDSVIVITNGLRLFPSRLNSLTAAGVTGLSVSLDGIDSQVASDARGMTAWQHKKIMSNLNAALERRRGADTPFEFVVNTVLSKANLDARRMASLVDFCNFHKTDWLKFTPVFDDGYLGNNAPWLRLEREDAGAVIELGEMICARAQVRTNPPHFWRAVSGILGGRRLVGKSCGLDAGQALLAHGELKFCAWLKKPVYGSPLAVISAESADKRKVEFRRARAFCETGPWCFCLQNIDHEWEVA